MTLAHNNTRSNNNAKPQWVLASNNKGKLAEFTRMFNEADVAVDFIPQATLNIDDAIEDGLSFIENALIKARHASRLSGLPAVADDSGLCVPLLGNAPGIHSARYAGTHGDSQGNNQKLLADLLPLRNHMAGDKETDSTIELSIKKPSVKAYFVCVLAMVRHADDPLPIIAEGRWQGEITDSVQGSNGFGYDPIFWVPDLQMTAAELDPATKNKLSHRGQAIKKLLAQVTTDATDKMIT